jgi:GTP-binding protein HflX
VALPHIPAWEAQDSLDELARLAATATLRPGERVLQSRKEIHPAFYMGKGKAAELKFLARGCGADLIIFDNDLSPAQMRNVEELSGLRTLDRSGLILDIFALHARTHTAQVQVELAQLTYLLPRLTRMWTHLSRQAGGGAIRGMGAAGVRGPGETQLEIDRRMIRKRIRSLKAKLDRIGTQLATSRKSRGDLFKVALVGYTNAGKSSLMRALSGAAVLVQDQLFATLDSTTRTVELNRGKVLLTDTVGFIRRLPHHLFASFRATLEEAAVADLLLHVVDLSHPYYESQIETVEKVLRDLQFKPKSTLLVYNKFDQVECGEAGNESPIHSEKVVTVSALTGFGIDLLKEKIEEVRLSDSITLDLQIPQQEGRLLSRLRAQGEVLAQDFHNDEVLLRLRLDKTWVERWQLHRFAPALGRARQ